MLKWIGTCLVTGLFAVSLGAQTPARPAPSLNAPAASPAAPQAAPAKPAAPPLRLQTLDPATRADPFPPVNPAFFTATSPSVATVDSYLKAVLGFDANRIWRVEGIQTTPAPGVAKVTVYVSDRAATAKVSTAVFFVTPDGRHAIAAGTGVTPFAAQPYAEARAMLAARATGPFHGAAEKDLEFVEFTDLQCPRCKDAEPVIKRLAADFPKARIVYQSLPIPELHPFAQKAAAYGSCVAKVSNEAFFNYVQAVYDTQNTLTEDTAEETLRAAVTKAGGDPTAVAACATSLATRDELAASTRLADELGVAETPTLVVNGRPLPLTIPYETLKQIIVFQAGLDGVAGAAASSGVRGLTGK